MTFAVPADRKLDRHAVRRKKGWKKMRFATREEVLELTSLTRGSKPPFGSLFRLPTHYDERLGEIEAINFNAGATSANAAICQSLSVRAEHYGCRGRSNLGET